MIEPYKGRSVDKKRRVEVYRNLNRRDGVWYSVRQNGKVVGHTQLLRLRDCYFVVNEAGRQRVLRTGRKNVHAFVLGYVAGKRARRYDLGHPHHGRYNPYTGPRFQMQSGQSWSDVSIACQVQLDNLGIHIWMARA